MQAGPVASSVRHRTMEITSMQRRHQSDTGAAKALRGFPDARHDANSTRHEGILGVVDRETMQMHCFLSTAINSLTAARTGTTPA
jgi:hypothetical protein